MEERRRICLPKFTHAEPGDEVVLRAFYSENDTYLKITGYHDFFEIIEKAREFRDTATTMDEYNKLNLKLEYMCKQLDAALTIDKQRRLLIPVHITEQLNWYPYNQFDMEGLGTSLLIKKRKPNTKKP